MAVDRMKTSEDVRGLARELGVTRRCLYKWRTKLEAAEPGEEASRPSTHAAAHRKSCQLIHTAITAGTSRVAHDPLCLHAVANTPAGLMEFIRSYDSIRFGLPSTRGGPRPLFNGLWPRPPSPSVPPSPPPTRP